MLRKILSILSGLTITVSAATPVASCSSKADFNFTQSDVDSESDGEFNRENRNYFPDTYIISNEVLVNSGIIEKNAVDSDYKKLESSIYISTNKINFFNSKKDYVKGHFIYMPDYDHKMLFQILLPPEKMVERKHSQNIRFSINNKSFQFNYYTWQRFLWLSLVNDVNIKGQYWTISKKHAIQARLIYANNFNPYNEDPENKYWFPSGENPNYWNDWLFLYDPLVADGVPPIPTENTWVDIEFVENGTEDDFIHLCFKKMDSDDPGKNNQRTQEVSQIRPGVEYPIQISKSGGIPPIEVAD